MLKKGILLIFVSTLVMVSSGCPPEVEKPVPPSSFTATALSSSEIALDWIDNSTNETGFLIERSPNGSSSWMSVTTTAANAASYDDTGLTAGTTYYYRLCATNSAGDSAYASANATTEAEALTFFGSWSADSMTTDGFTVTDVLLTFYEDGTFTELIRVGVAPWMAVGTFAPVTAPADTTITLTINQLIGHGTPPTLPITAYLKYSNLTDTTVDIQSDGDPPDGYDDAPVAFNRETTPDPDKIFGTCACETLTADAMTMDDVFLTMNEGGTFSVVMYTTDFGYQTGTFTPATAPADTDLTFHVVTSSGPDQPPPGTDYSLSYSNPTVHAVDIELDPMADFDWDGPFDFIR